MIARSIKVNAGFSRRTVMQECLHWGLLLDSIKHISGYDVRASYDEALRQLKIEIQHSPYPGELTTLSLKEIDTQIISYLERHLT